MTEVLLRYQRTDVDRCSGVIIRDAEELERFSSLPFSKMMGSLSSVLRCIEAPVVRIQRTDRQGLVPMRLDDLTVELLRTDPVLCIRLMHYESKPAPVKANPVFRSGYDTLADAVGEQVYLGRDGSGAVECPGCANWVAFTPSFNCPCGLLLQLHSTEHWAYANTQDLIAARLPRYYLPRAWNQKGLWISWADLSALYNQWKTKEKS